MIKRKNRLGLRSGDGTLNPQVVFTPSDRVNAMLTLMTAKEIKEGEKRPTIAGICRQAIEDHFDKVKTPEMVIRLRDRLGETPTNGEVEDARKYQAEHERNKPYTP